MIIRLLTKIFGESENFGDYLYRWTIARFWGGRALYLHKIVSGDWSRHLHDHPKRFTVLMLSGGYIETSIRRTGYEGTEVPTHATKGVFVNTTKTPYQAPCLRSFAAAHIHRIMDTMNGRPCWTLVYTGPRVRDWGFWVDGNFVESSEYGREYIDKGLNI